MYVIGKGHEHEGPGTSMVQMIHWTPSQERQVQGGFGKGLGCGCGCDGKPGGCGKGLLGLGIFDSMDPSTWGAMEWGVVGVGVYAGLSLLGDTKRGVARVGRVGRAARKAV